MCLFGVFHGLVFLPVALSVLGPEAYANAEAAEPPAQPDGEQLRDNLNKSALIKTNSSYA